MLPVPARRGKTRANKSDDNKENGSLAVGLQGARLLPSSSSSPPPPIIPPRSLPLSDVEDYSNNYHLNSRCHQHPVPQYFLPEISRNAKCGVMSKVQVGGPHQLTQFWTYAPGHGGSVDHWKKMARKAELEMHLEQEQHKSDREKDLDSIHRLRCRISALEAAAQDRDVMIEKQRRKINFLKSQLGGVNKRFGKELSILRNQSEQMQIKITSVTGVNEKKILELKEELQLSETKRKLLENQLELIYKCIEEPLEMFNLTELHERAPESVHQGTAVKGLKKVWKKPGESNDGGIQGFDDFTMPKGDPHGTRDVINGCNSIKRRQAKTTMAGKILQLRSDNSLLSKQIGQRDERLKTLFHEAEHLRKQLKEAIISRSSALSQVRETERLFEKLEAMEPLIVKAGIINEQDLLSISEEKTTLSPAKIRGPVDNESKHQSKENVTADTIITVTNEAKAETGKISRKQAFKKWGNILNKIRSALLVFISKVHATSQLELNLKLQRESLNSFAWKLQQEVLVELDPGSLNAIEMDKSRGQDHIGAGKQRDFGNITIDRELIHKIIVGLREQKRKLVVATGRVEDLKNEKMSSESNLCSKQKKISELERKLDMLGFEQEILHSFATCISKMLAHVEKNRALTEPAIEVKSKQKDMMPIETVEKKCKLEGLLRRVQLISNERDELKVVLETLHAENQSLHRELSSLQESIKCIYVAADDETSNETNLESCIQQIKSRKEELESFYEEASVYQNAVTKNLQILEGIVAEGEYPETEKLHGLEYIVKRWKTKSHVPESFVHMVLRLPDIILKINHIGSEHKHFNSKLQNLELDKKIAEDKVREMERHVRASVQSKEELESMKDKLKEIHCLLSSESDVETESLGSKILASIHKLKEEMEDLVKDNGVNKLRIEEMESEMSHNVDILNDLLKRFFHLKEDIAEELKRNRDYCKDTEVLKHTSLNNFLKDEALPSDMATEELISSLKISVEDIQHLRTLEKACTSDAVSKLKQELESVKEQLAKHSDDMTSHWNERLQSLSGQITQMQAEKESLFAELSASSQLVNDLEITIKNIQEERNTTVSVLEKERDSLKELRETLVTEIRSLKLQNEEHSENSRKELETLKNKLLSMKDEHAGSIDSVEELKRVIKEEKMTHEQALLGCESRIKQLEEEIKNLASEKETLGLNIQSLDNELKERDIANGSLMREIKSLRQNLEITLKEQSKSGNEIANLQLLMKEKDQATSILKSQYVEKVEILEKEISGLQQEKEKLIGDLEKFQKYSNRNEVLCNQKLQELQSEVLRLGGVEIDDEVHKSKCHAACARAHKQLLVDGTNGGLSQAAIHYFSLRQHFNGITFENGNLPGSQSSNMLAELILQSSDDAPIYETKSGDVLGLSVKVKGLNDRNAREILYNTNVIRTDEIMEAIKGQQIDNFSLWPDLVSSWKWERSANKGWVLVCIKWRFLFKNIFPEISEPLQILSIKQGG